jgi:predicted membrane chloride channel (bestrophin family)
LAGLWSFLVAMLGVAVGHWGGTGSKDAFAKACSGIATATSALSAPLALLLTLRTNAALARLQEARQAWGKLVPPTYSRHLSRILTIWLMAFPMASMAVVALLSSTVMMARCAPIVVVSTILVSYGLIGLDEIGMEIEHPFPLLPLQQLAGAVQNSVGMQFLDNECCFGASDKDAESSSRNYSVSVMPTVPL